MPGFLQFDRKNIVDLFAAIEQLFVIFYYIYPIETQVKLKHVQSTNFFTNPFNLETK